MVDAQHPGHAQVVGQGRAKLRVTALAQCLRSRGRKAPRLALGEEAVGRGADRHVGGVLLAPAPDVVAVGMDPDRKVEGENLAPLRQSFGKLDHLFPGDPLGIDVIAEVDRVDVTPAEQAAAKRSRPGPPIDPEAIDGGAKARVVDKFGPFEHEVVERRFAAHRRRAHRLGHGAEHRALGGRHGCAVDVRTVDPARS